MSRNLWWGQDMVERCYAAAKVRRDRARKLQGGKKSAEYVRWDKVWHMLGAWLCLSI